MHWRAVRLVHVCVNKVCVGVVFVCLFPPLTRVSLLPLRDPRMCVCIDVCVSVTSGRSVALVQAGQMGPWREKATGNRLVLF